MLTSNGSPAKMPRPGRIEAMLLLEIGRQPGDAEIEDHAVRHVHHAQRDHVAAGEQAPPVFAAGACGLSGSRSCDDGLRAPPRSLPDAATDRRETRRARSPSSRYPRAPKQKKICSPRQEVQQPEDERRREAARPGARPRRRCLARCRARAPESSARTCARRTATPPPRRRRTGSAPQHDGIADRCAGRRRQAGPPEHDPREHQLACRAGRPTTPSGSRNTAYASWNTVNT